MSRNATAARSPVSGPANGAVPAKLKAQRSRVTNGRTLFIKGGGGPVETTAWHRRLKDLFQDHVADLGGIEHCSTAEQSLCRRAANLELQLELIERFWAGNGGQASERTLHLYQRVTSSLRRVLESLGLQRRQKDVTPTLKEYLDAKYSEPDDGDAEAAE
jgi:hypothetical protein